MDSIAILDFGSQYAQIIARRYFSRSDGVSAVFFGRCHSGATDCPGGFGIGDWAEGTIAVFGAYGWPVQSSGICAPASTRKDRLQTVQRSRRKSLSRSQT